MDSHKLTDQQIRVLKDFVSYFYEGTLQAMSDMLHNLNNQHSDAAANDCADEAAKIDVYREIVAAELERATS